jgi:hypothetical protein
MPTKNTDVSTYKNSSEDKNGTGTGTTGCSTRESELPLHTNVQVPK